MFKIALDAGHGRYTAGKRCMKAIDPNETREWVLNARICDKIEAGLQAYNGVEVLRVDDTTGAKDVTMSARCKAANNFKANLYLSIHHNAGIKGGKGGGIVAYTWKKPDAQLQTWQKMFYDALIAKTGLKGDRATPLAKSNFYVLVNTNMQAILIENGFMDSTTDVPVILSELFANNAAAAYVETLFKIGGLTKKETTEPAKDNTAKDEPAKDETAAFVPYRVKVDITNLNIRAGAGTNYAKKGKTGKGVFTIVDEATGQGSKKGWGKLKSGAGWISLDYCTKI